MTESDEFLERALAAARAHDEASTPSYLQPFIFLGALLAAAMITVGIATLFEIRFEGAQTIVIGGIYSVAALALHRGRYHEFTDHLALSLSIGGHAFVLVGVGNVRSAEDPEIAVFLMALALCALLYGLYRDPLHRFLSCVLVIVLARFAFPAIDLPDALHAVVALLLLLCGVFVMRDRQSPVWRPMAHACGLGLPIILLPLSPRGLWFEDPEMPRAWISAGVLGIGLLWVLRFASVRLGVSASVAVRGCVVVLIGGLVALPSPGILAALFLLVLGYAAHHWRLAVVGLASLPVYIFKYYYNLELDLMTKSGVLVGSGVLLLIARWVLLRMRVLQVAEVTR